MAGASNSPCSTPAWHLASYAYATPPSRPLPPVPGPSNGEDLITNQPNTASHGVRGIAPNAPHGQAVRGTVAYDIASLWLMKRASANSNVASPSKRPLSVDHMREAGSATKAPRTTHQPLTSAELDQDDENIVYGLPHSQSYINGLDFTCACGKVYSRAYALRRHIDASNGSKYSCLDCQKTFSRKDSLRRHEETEHKGNKLQCPGCQHYFRKDGLTTHLASPQFEACRITVDTLYSQSNGFSLDARPVVEDFWTPEVAERVPHRIGGRAVTRNGSEDSTSLPTSGGDHLANSLQYYQTLKLRSAFKTTHEPCTLCGLPVGLDERALIDHIRHHTEELATKRYRCLKCKVDFNFAADLHLHLESVMQGHCGFKFVHNGTGTEEGKDCNGHHPPSGTTCSYDNHDRMLVTVMLWQNAQLRAIRIAVARLEAKLLLGRHHLRHSLGDDGLMCLELLSRLSIGSIDSFRSAPAWLHYQSRSMSRRTTTSTAPSLSSTGSAHPPREPGPMSDVGILNSTTKPLPAVKSRNTYIEQLESMRSSAKSVTRTASRVRYHAKSASRYFLPGQWHPTNPGVVECMNATSTWL